jgi:hypothetical protein
MSPAGQDRFAAVLAARGRATTGVAAGAHAALPFAVALDAGALRR